MGNWKHFWYSEDKTQKRDYKLTCAAPNSLLMHPWASSSDQWVIKYANGNGIINNVPKDLAQEICRRWNSFEKQE